jgi:hypothetical protein
LPRTEIEKKQWVSGGKWDGCEDGGVDGYVALPLPEGGNSIRYSVIESVVGLAPEGMSLLMMEVRGRDYGAYLGRPGRRLETNAYPASKS